MPVTVNKVDKSPRVMMRMSRFNVNKVAYVTCTASEMHIERVNFFSINIFQEVPLL